MISSSSCSIRTCLLISFLFTSAIWPGAYEVSSEVSEALNVSPLMSLRGSESVEWMVSHGWIPFEKGGSFVAGEDTTYIQSDMACLEFVLEFANSGNKDEQVQLDFLLVVGSETMALRTYWNKEMTDTTERLVTVPANGSIKLFFRHACIDYENLMDEKRPYVLFKPYKQAMGLLKPASHDTFYGE